MVEVKTFRIEGLMLISVDRLPRWQKFTIEVRALNKDHALDLAFSLLGSRHKVKRENIKVVKVKEISPEEALDRRIKDLASLTRMVI
uniref:Large ribosomal subunit protein eL20 n=1 Tax=Ignisphaera aggregans TaxID=334771 RepID=A0A7J2U2R2_9CREN